MKSLSSAKVVGEAQGTSDQIHEFQEDDLTLFVAVSTATQGITTPVDLLLTIRSIAKSLWDDFLKRKADQEGLYNSLKSSVTDANKHFSSTQVALDIGAVLVAPGAVYYVLTSGLEVFLIRDTPIKLTTSGVGIRGGSGTLKPGDVFSLLTRSLSPVLMEQDFRRDFEDIADSLRAHVASLQSSGIAILLHSPEEEEKDQEFIAEETLEVVPQPRLRFEPPAPEESVVPPPTPISRLAFLRLSRPRLFASKSENELNVRVRSQKASIAGGVLVLFLFISIALGIRQNNLKSTENAFAEKVTAVRTILDEAQKSGSLNRARTRELLTEAQGEIETFTEKEKESQEYKELSTEIKTDFSTLTGLYQASPENFLDLTLQSSDFNGKVLTTADNIIYVLDGTRNRVVSVEISSKRTQTVGNSEGLSEIKNIIAYSDRLFAVTSDGLYELTSRSAKVLSADWKENNLFSLFASNLYVLSQGDNMIYRYSGQADGFGERSTWIAPNVEVHIDTAASWSIDGTIWVLSKEGRLTRFTQGLPQIVSISGVTADLTGATKFVTNEELANIYVLDTKNKRIVVLDKKAAFVAEYVANEIADTQDIVVSEEEGKIILLTGSKLLSIPLTRAQ